MKDLRYLTVPFCLALLVAGYQDAFGLQDGDRAARQTETNGHEASGVADAARRAQARAPAAGAWLLEKTEFVVEKVDAALMQKDQPTESGGDGSGSAGSTFGNPARTWRMKIAWTSPAKVLVPGKEIDFKVTVSDAGSDDPNGKGYGSIGVNCPALSAVWYGPAAGFDLNSGQRSKEASKAYTPPKAAPGTLLYIIADYGVFVRKTQFIYTYRFTSDAENAPSPLITSSARPTATAPTTPADTPGKGSVLPRGAGARGTSGMNVEKAAAKLNAIALDSPLGYCALHVQRALEAGGVSESGHPSVAREYGRYLLARGFIRVSPEGYQPQKGDIVVIQPESNRVGPGHIAMYDGGRWIADARHRIPPWGSGPPDKLNQERYRFYRP